MARVQSQSAVELTGRPPLAKRGSKRAWIWSGVVVAVLAASTVGVYAWNRSRTASGFENVPTFVVRRGPLIIDVKEKGTIRARQQEVIKCEVEGSTTVITIVPEGTHVQKGDLLIELDGSKMADLVVDKQIIVENAHAALIRATENLAVAKNQAESDVSKAELDFQFAKEDLEKYIKGDFPNELKTANSKIMLAKEDLERATNKLDWSKRLYEEKYLSTTELQADQFAHNKSKSDLELAEANLNLLKEFTYRRKVAELESAVKQLDLALDRVKRKASADVVQAEADLRAKTSEHERQVSQLEKLKKQVEKTRIEAPMDGLVVYATSNQSGFGRSSLEPLAQGVTVRERQDLIYLPTTSSMMAELRIPESSLEKVRPGLRVRIRVEAMPGEEFTGTVVSISPMPDSQMSWMNPDLKVYPTIIHIDGDGSMMRTGMTCQAQIIVDYYEDCLYVPVQAVVRVKGQPVVHVIKGKQSEQRPVTLGLDNNQFARVLSGLEVGEVVMLTPPLDQSAVENDEQGEGNLPTSRPAELMPVAPPNGTAPTTMPAGQRRTGVDFRSMNEEQRAELRKKLEAMTPEERQKYMQEMGFGQGRGPRGDGSGGGRTPRGEGGMRGGRPGAPAGGDGQ